MEFNKIAITELINDEYGNDKMHILKTVWD